MSLKGKHMADPFDIENERIEISDDEGNKLVFRPVAVIGSEEDVYYVFGAMRVLDDGNTRQMRLMFTRRQEGADGVVRFIPCEDESEIQQIAGNYLRQAISEIAKKAADQTDEQDFEEQACDLEHGVAEFCYCGQLEYLQ